jgi:YggT family protein
VVTFGAVGGVQIVRYLLELYVFILIARALLSWFPMHAGSPLLPVMRVLDRLTEPVLAPIRRILPPLRAGGMAIDLSIIVAILVIQVVASYL